MKLNKISCPDCGASINLSIDGQSYAFCPYCGSHFAVDDGNRTVTRNYNTRVDFHDTYTDDAAIERERRKDRENARDHKETVMLLIIQKPTMTKKAPVQRPINMLVSMLQDGMYIQRVAILIHMSEHCRRQHS